VNYWSSSLLVLLIIAALFGFGVIVTGAVVIFKVLFFIFLVLFLVTVIRSAISLIRNV